MSHENAVRFVVRRGRKGVRLVALKRGSVTLLTFALAPGATARREDVQILGLGQGVEMVLPVMCFANTVRSA
jgi:hypothetical protein